MSDSTQDAVISEAQFLATLIATLDPPFDNLMDAIHRYCRVFAAHKIEKVAELLHDQHNYSGERLVREAAKVTKDGGGE